MIFNPGGQTNGRSDGSAAKAPPLPPHNREAETAVLGSCLRLNIAIADVTQVLRPEDFYLDAHQRIFRAMLCLFDAGKAVDTVTLADELKRREHVGDVGGYAYLAELWDASPSAGNVGYYAAIVRDQRILRDLGHAARIIGHEVATPHGTADEILESAEKRIFAIAQAGTKDTTVDLKTAIKESFERIDERECGQMRGIPTGHSEIDRMTGGLHDGELLIVAARPGMGKTAYCLDLAKHVGVAQQTPTLIISLEMSRRELADRLLCNKGSVDFSKLRKGTLDLDDLERLIEASAYYDTGRISIDDSPSQTVLRISSNARRHRLRKGGIGCLIIDYLQLIEAEDSRVPRHEQVGVMTRRLKCLARELEIPIVLLAQLNRGPEDRPDHKPRSSDLRESGSTEQDADAVFLLNRPEMFDPSDRPGLAEIVIGKQRNGPVGTVTMRFLKQFMRFEDMEFRTSDGRIFA